MYLLICDVFVYMYSFVAIVYLFVCLCVQLFVHEFI